MNYASMMLGGADFGEILAYRFAYRVVEESRVSAALQVSCAGCQVCLHGLISFLAAQCVKCFLLTVPG
jgi:hypothetical protein